MGTRHAGERALLLLFSLSSVGCGGGAKSSEPEARPDRGDRLAAEATAGGTEAAAEPEASPTPINMQRHFDDVGAARRAIIAGNLARYRIPLDRIADTNYAVDMPVSWRSWVGEMQAVARESAGAGTVAEAARAIAELGSTCGGCHLDTGGGPDVDAAVAPPPRASATDVVAQMHRHAWATEQLWLGLTAPSRVAWVAGAEVVAAQGADRNGDLAVALGPLRELGLRAVTARRNDRPALYAEILSTCADCHTDPP